MSFNDNSLFYHFIAWWTSSACVEWILNFSLTTMAVAEKCICIYALNHIHKRRLGFWFVYAINAYLWIHFWQMQHQQPTQCLSQSQIHMWFAYSKLFCSHQMKINFSAFFPALFSLNGWWITIQFACVCVRANYLADKLMQIHENSFGFVDLKDVNNTKTCRIVKSEIVLILFCLNRFLNWTNF